MIVTQISVWSTSEVHTKLVDLVSFDQEGVHQYLIATNGAAPDDLEDYVKAREGMLVGMDSEGVIMYIQEPNSINVGDWGKLKLYLQQDLDNWIDSAGMDATGDTQPWRTRMHQYVAYLAYKQQVEQAGLMSRELVIRFCCFPKEQWPQLANLVLDYVTIIGAVAEHDNDPEVMDANNNHGQV